MSPAKMILIAALAIPSACATPLERCISSAQEDAGDIRRAIATTQGNISRGYAIHRTTEDYVVLQTCFDHKKRPYPCPEIRNRTVETLIEIDVEQQRRTLADLLGHLPAAEDRARRGAQSCAARHPE